MKIMKIMNSIKLKRFLAALGAFCLIFSFFPPVVNALQGLPKIQAEEATQPEAPVEDVPNAEVPNAEAPKEELPNTEVPNTEVPNAEVPPTNGENDPELAPLDSGKYVTVTLLGYNGETLVSNDPTDFGKTYAKKIEIPTPATGYEFTGWYVNNSLFDFTKTPITSNITARAHQKIIPKPEPEPTYSVTFYGAKDSNKSVTQSGFKKGDKISTKFNSIPTPDVPAWANPAWDSPVTLDTIVNKNLRFYSTGNTNVTFKKAKEDDGATCSWQTDDVQYVRFGYYESGNVFQVPKIQLAEAKIVNDITITIPRKFLGWCKEEALTNIVIKPHVNSYFPTEANIILYPKFEKKENADSKIKVIIDLSKCDSKAKNIEISDVSMASVLDISRLNVSIAGKTHNGYSYTIGDGKSSKILQSPIDLATIKELKANDTLTLTPTYGDDAYSVTFVSPCGFNATQSDAQSTTIAVPNIAYNALVPKDTFDAITARVIVPETIKYQIIDDKGNLVEKEKIYKFSGKWVIAGTKAEWKQTDPIIKSITVNPLMLTTCDGLDCEDIINIFNVDFFDSAVNDPNPIKSYKMFTNSKIPKHPLPTRFGYTYTGWSTESDRTKKQPLFDFDNSKVTADTKLYAVYSKDAIVTLNSDGGNINSVLNVQEGKTIKEVVDDVAFKRLMPENISKVANSKTMKSVGWSLTRQNGASIDDIIKFDIEKEVFTKEMIEKANDRRITLWAWYDESDTQVVFHENYVPDGGTVEKIKISIVTPYMPLILPEYEPYAWADHNFVGWSLTEKGNLLPKNHKIEKGKKTHVYAQWDRGYTIKYYVPSSNSESDKPVETKFYETLPQSIPEFYYVIPGGGTTPQWVSKDEWYTDKDFKNKVDFATLLTAEKAGKITKIYGKAENIKTGESCKITLDALEGKFTDEQTKEISALTGKYLWTDSTYEAALKVKPVLPNGDTRIGLGWYTEAECIHAINKDSALAMPTTYYQKWVCPLTFDPNNTSNKSRVSANIITGNYVSRAQTTSLPPEALADLQKNDSNSSPMHLAGWKWKYKDDKYFDGNPPKQELWNFQENTVQNALTLTAAWDYTVAFSAEDGTLPDDLASKPFEYVREDATDKTLARPTDPTKSGNTFDYWYYYDKNGNPERFYFKGEEPPAEKKSAKFVARAARAATGTEVMTNIVLLPQWKGNPPPPVIDPIDPVDPVDPIDPIIPPPPAQNDYYPTYTPSFTSGTAPSEEVPPVFAVEEKPLTPVDVKPQTPVEIKPEIPAEEPKKVILPQSGVPEILPIIGVILMLPWLSMFFFKKFKKDI